MRIAQSRTPAGCAFALAAGWLVWSFALQRVDLIDYVLVGFLIAYAIFLIVYRKVYPDAILITDELPKPGASFRAKVETPLKNPPSEIRVQLILARRRARYGKVVWQSEQVARGSTFDVDFNVPPDVEVDAWSNWRLAIRSGLYRADFDLKAEGSARNRAASA